MQTPAATEELCCSPTWIYSRCEAVKALNPDLGPGSVTLCALSGGHLWKLLKLSISNRITSSWMLASARLCSSDCSGPKCSCASFNLEQKKPEHISPTLASNHWLPVCFRIDLKILLFLNVVMARLHDWHAPSLWHLLGRGPGLEGTTPSQLLHQNCGIRWDEYSVQPSNSKEKSTLKCVCYGFSTLQAVDLHSICSILSRPNLCRDSNLCTATM